MLVPILATWKWYIHFDAHSISMQHWTKLGSDPPARASHTTSCIDGPHTRQRHPLLMVVGGWDVTKRRLGDVWLLDVDKGIWSEVNFHDIFYAFLHNSFRNMLCYMQFAMLFAIFSTRSVSQTCVHAYTTVVADGLLHGLHYWTPFWGEGTSFFTSSSTLSSFQGESSSFLINSFDYIHIYKFFRLIHTLAISALISCHPLYLFEGISIIVVL